MNQTAFVTVLGDAWPLGMLLVVGFLPSEIWRWIAVFVSGGLHEEAKLLHFVRPVASALLACVVAKLLLTPSGALVLVPIPWRAGSLAIGLGVFFLLRRSVLAGVLAGEASLILAASFA